MGHAVMRQAGVLFLLFLREVLCNCLLYQSVLSGYNDSSNFYCLQSSICVGSWPAELQEPEWPIYTILGGRP